MRRHDGDLGAHKTTFILDRARRGDPAALDELSRRLQPRIERWIRKHRGRDVAAAEETVDLAQDVQMELLSYLPRVELSDSDALERYLFRTIVNTLRDRGRRLRALRRDVARKCPLPDDSILSLDRPVGAREATSPSSAAARNEERALVRLALPLLKPDEEELFLRLKILGHSPTEVARERGEDADALRMRASRIAVRLTKFVNKLKTRPLSEVVSEDPGQAGAFVA